MNVNTMNWLIASAPAEVILALLIFTSLVSLLLLLLAAEEGRYPEFGRILERLFAQRARARRARRLLLGGAWNWKGVSSGQN